MPTTVIMKTSRPDGADGTYKQGSTYTIADDLAAYFLSIGAAKRTSTRSEQTGAAISGNAAGQFPSAPALSSQVPVTASTSSAQGIESAQQIPVALYSSAVPFVLPAGDGGTNGLAFNGGGGGAFTFGAAPMAGLGSGLAGFPCFFRLPANAGGSGCVEGWYYGNWLTDTTGIIYGDRYASGNPSSAIPSSPTVFPGSPTGRITQTTSAVTAVTGVTLPAGAMGRDGELQWEIMTGGDTGGAVKNFIWNINEIQINREQTATFPISEKLLSIHNAGAFNKQVSSKWGRGIGLADAVSPVFTSIDTSIDNAMTVSMQIVANTATAVLLKSRWILTKKG